MDAVHPDPESARHVPVDAGRLHLDVVRDLGRPLDDREGCLDRAVALSRHGPAWRFG